MLDGLREGFVVSRWNEKSCGVPQLAEGRDIGQDESTACLRGLENRESERLVAGRGDEDRPLAEISRNLSVRQAPKGLDVPCRNLRPVRSLEWTRCQYRNRDAFRGPVKG